MELVKRKLRRRTSAQWSGSNCLVYLNIFLPTFFCLQAVFSTPMAVTTATLSLGKSIAVIFTCVKTKKKTKEVSYPSTLNGQL